MKTSTIIFLTFVALRTLWAQVPNDFELRRTEIVTRMDSLATVAGFYPPNVEDSLQLEEARRVFHSIANDLEALATERPDSACLRESLGELYRMGHNLDVPGSWEKAEENLEEAIDLDSEAPGAYFTLGLLYVNSDIRLASKAEDLFEKAIEHSNGHPNPYIYQSLAFAHVYQGENQDALIAIDEFLKLTPGDKQGVSVRNMILKKLNR
jgi:tetratricopeptide (TPR) repeat protein